MTDIKRGQIYWVTIKKDGTDHKQSGRRPAIIIQNDIINNSALLTTLIIPTTTKEERANDLDNVLLEKTELPETSVALCSNLQIIDKYKIKEKNYICDVNDEDMKKINEYLKNTIGI